MAIKSFIVEAPEEYIAMAHSVIWQWPFSQILNLTETVAKDKPSSLICGSISDEEKIFITLAPIIYVIIHFPLSQMMLPIKLECLSSTGLY